MASPMSREPLRHLRAKAFEVESIERSVASVIERTAARKPTEAST